MGLQETSAVWPPTILFGQARFILLRGRASGEPGQRLAVIPRHPL
jgi:hypothetical protein